jgi:hypothetical protein
MSNFNKEMAHIMAGTGAKVIPGEVIGNVNPITEWIKWLSYLPDFQMKKIEAIKNTKAANLSLSELDELRSFVYQNRMLDLIKIYGTDQISKDEYLEVYDYMSKESIDRIMLSKLTKEELEYAKEKIAKCRLLSREELNMKVKKEQETYNSLSMVDSYILHIISRIDYRRSMAKLNNEINAKLSENDVMRRMSYYYASNPYRN